VLEDVQQMSLREVGIDSSSSLEPPRERRRRERSADGRSRSEDTRRGRGEGRSGSRNPPATSASREAVPPRVVEHQSSLRSLLSASELDSQEMEEEIMRQIMEEGLLDGIDLSNIDVAQEDEISERIALAYRQRQTQRQRQRRDRRETPPEIIIPPPRDDQPGQRRHRYARSESGTSTPRERERERNHRPPISRPGLLDVANQGARAGHARSSSQGSSRSARSELRPSSLSVSSRQTPSLSQPSDRPNPGRRRRSDDQQHSTLAERQQLKSLNRSTTDPSIEDTQVRPAPAATRLPPTLYPEPRISCHSCGKDNLEHILHYNCSGCDNGAFNLCQPCYRSGKGCKHWFGFGWAAWPAYQKKAPPGGYPASHEYPHVFRGHRYQRPRGHLTESTTSPGTFVSEEEPGLRLEDGVFCDICSNWANACYWKCDYCNEGEWGYCNDCVNRGQHCTHPLLPVTHMSKEHTPPQLSTATDASNHPTPPYPDDSPPTTPSLTPKSASLIRGPGQVTLANYTYRPLTFTTICNICTYPILPSHTRFHCPTCNNGDYDICSPCYKKLGLVGKISEGNGINGWRRCLHDHRMIVVGFEDRDGGQRRIVVRDLVGGLSFREEEIARTITESITPTASTTAPKEEKWSWRETDGSRHHSHSASSPPPSQPQRRYIYPPDGGVGLRIQARWSYFPAADATDELSFPRFAEITEAEDINGDWFWGVYAGSKGLFPGNYGRVVGGNAERRGMV
jgi:hypothetical protein